MSEHVEAHFSHPDFLDFFAACWLYEHRQEFVGDLVETHGGMYRWNRALIMLAAWPERADAILGYLLAKSGPYPALVAAQVLAESTDDSRHRPRVTERLSRHLDQAWATDTLLRLRAYWDFAQAFISTRWELQDQVAGRIRDLPRVNHDFVRALLDAFATHEPMGSDLEPPRLFWTLVTRDASVLQIAFEALADASRDRFQRLFMRLGYPLISWEDQDKIGPKHYYVIHEGIESPHRTVSFTAAIWLSLMFWLTTDARRTLVDACEDPDPWIRSNALQVMGPLWSRDDELGRLFPDIVTHALQDPDPIVRKAIPGVVDYAWSTMPEFVAEALAACLTDTDYHVRHRAALYINRQTEHQPTSVWTDEGVLDALIMALGDITRPEFEDDRPVVRRGSFSMMRALMTPFSWETIPGQIAEALGRLARSEPPVLERLVAVIEDPSQEILVRQWALKALEKCGPWDPAVKATLQKASELAPRPEPDREAELIITRLAQLPGDKPETLSAFLEVLHDDDTPYSAVHWVLKKLPDPSVFSPEVVPALVQLRHRLDYTIIKSDIMTALTELAKRHPEVIPSLARLLKSHDLGDFIVAAQGLGNVGQASPEALDILLDYLRRAPAIRWRGLAEVLLDAGCDAPEVIEAYIRGLEPTLRTPHSEREYAGWILIWALETFGPQSPVTIDLVHTARSSDAHRESKLGCGVLAVAAVRLVSEAVRTDDSLIDALQATQNHPNAPVRYVAATVLAKLASTRADLIPVLVPFVTDENEETCQVAAEALAGLEPATVLAELERVMADARRLDHALKLMQQLQAELNR